MQKNKDHIALLVIRSYKKFKIMSTMTGENIEESHISGTHDLKKQIVYFKCQKTYICKHLLNYIHQDMGERNSYILHDGSPGFCWRWHYTLYNYL